MTPALMAPMIADGVAVVPESPEAFLAGAPVEPRRLDHS